MLNAGDGGAATGADMDALGLYACGHQTVVRHVEVAHSAANGLTLRGGMAGRRSGTPGPPSTPG